MNWKNKWPGIWMNKKLLSGGIEWWQNKIITYKAGKKRKVYPDFLAFISPDNKIKKLSVLETKGDQLKGNEDYEI